MGKDSVFGPEDLKAYMAQQHIAGEIVHLDVPTLTVETAAAAIGTKPEQIVKSLLFRVRDGFALAVTCGTLPVEKRVLAWHYGVGRKKVDLADAETVQAVTGYPVGGVPPFGHRQSIPTFLDLRVLNHKEVFAGGGGGSSLVRLNSEDILKFTRAEVLDLHSLPEE
jgi:Cys-tRNA(Pro) deacylase